MTEYILFRDGQDPIAPAFNEASSKLKANKDVAIKDTQDSPGLGMSLILIETTDEALTGVKKDLPGWVIEPNWSMG